MAASTALSDLVLALSAFNAAYSVCDINYPAMVGFCIIGIAATFGTIKFALRSPPHSIVTSHKYWSWLSSALGLSLLAVGYYRKENLLMVGNVLISVSIALLLTKSYFAQSTINKVTEAISTVAVLSILFITTVQFNALGIIGAAMYVVGGLVFGTEGELYGMPRVDLFHYALVVGNVSLMKGLVLKPMPVFYKPSAN